VAHGGKTGDATRKFEPNDREAAKNPQPEARHEGGVGYLESQSADARRRVSRDGIHRMAGRFELLFIGATWTISRPFITASARVQARLTLHPAAVVYRENPTVTGGQKWRK